MHKKIAGLIGVVSAAVTLDAAQAAMPQQPRPDAALTASSFADLLNPIPNAVALLKNSDEALAAQGSESAKVELAQYYHHHNHYRRFFYHHHHHHYYHHHHHHHFYRY